MSYKFILDSSVIDEKSIDELKAAGLERACLSGKLSFYVTPPLLKECFHFASRGKMPEELKTCIKYLLGFKWQRIFNEISGSEGIYAMELKGKCPSEYLFSPYAYLREGIQNLVQGNEIEDNGKKEIQQYIENWEARKDQNRKVLCEIRDMFGSKCNPSFKEYFNSVFETTAIYKIKKSINSHDSKEVIIEYWQQHKDRCSHFNKFVEGELFVIWNAAVTKQKLDNNSQDDIEHLVYLNDVDGIVSNEKGFMKESARVLFPDKDYLSLDEFIKLSKN
ncbi:MAG: hypothetical protein HQL24_03415 [Candidatus Omnitrophica bacterium]|nr:hypothetical protein [Candidatus Omnitrophota bacterium]